MRAVWLDYSGQYLVSRVASSLMVLYCTALHLFWGLLILVDIRALGATPVAALHVLFNFPLISIVLILVSILAMAGLCISLPWNVAFLLPQQSLLLISAAGAIAAICSGQFADGVIRPVAFIAVDQVHVILASIGHAIAIIFQAQEHGK